MTVFEHLLAVLDYAEIGEEADYMDQDEQGKKMHILTSIWAVRQWLDQGGLL